MDSLNLTKHESSKPATYPDSAYLPSGLQHFSPAKIILKLDDLNARNGTNKFIPVMDNLKEKKVKAGLETIGNGFDNSSLVVLTTYINVPLIMRKSS